jgi:hypothetical protein
MFLPSPVHGGRVGVRGLAEKGQGLGVVQGITPPLSPRPASEAGKHVPLYSLSARRGGMFLPSPVHGGRAGVRGSTGKGKG